MSEAPWIFRCYASVDNEVPRDIKDRQEWGSFFLSNLRYELSQRAVPGNATLRSTRDSQSHQSAAAKRP